MPAHTGRDVGDQRSLFRFRQPDPDEALDERPHRTVGDAAACVSLLAGEGTGLAMAEAYVLAAMLDSWGRDYHQAFGRYQDLLMPFLQRKQSSAAAFASSFVPKTRSGIVFRDVVTRLLRIPFVADYFVGRDLRDDFQLPESPP